MIYSRHPDSRQSLLAIEWSERGYNLLLGVDILLQWNGISESSTKFSAFSESLPDERFPKGLLEKQGSGVLNLCAGDSANSYVHDDSLPYLRGLQWYLDRVVLMSGIGRSTQLIHCSTEESISFKSPFLGWRFYAYRTCILSNSLVVSGLVYLYVVFFQVVHILSSARPKVALFKLVRSIA